MLGVRATKPVIPFLIGAAVATTLCILSQEIRGSAGGCSDRELLARDLANSKIAALYSLEIVKRLDGGDVDGAKALAIAQLDSEVALIEHTSDLVEDREQKGSSARVIKAVGDYRRGSQKNR